ncbi:hypothetical protein D3C84_877440 [compost metagenome]
MRHGRGTALARRRRLEHFGGLGLHQQADIATEFAETAGDQAEHGAELHHAIALGVPRLIGQGQLQFSGQRLGNRHGLFAKGRKGSGRTAELQHQQARLEFGQALATACHRPQPAGDLHAEGDWRRMLQPGASGQWRGRVALGLGREGLSQLCQVAFDQFQSAA